MVHLVNLNNFDFVNMILDCAFKIKNRVIDFSNSMNGKVMGSMFFEPSTRTQFSFQAAMHKLGGHCICISDVRGSSIAKGESFSDTVKIMSIYSDVIVIRHKCDGAAKAATLFSNCPVINAGDGIHLHPTQTLVDIFTIKEIKKTLDGLSIGFCGDLKFSRPVNSLVELLFRNYDNRFYFISTKEQRISTFLRNLFDNLNFDFLETDSLEKVISKLDVLYMTRVQKERFKMLSDYEKQKGRFILNKKMLNLAKSSLTILHPLPRLDEIDVEVDDDSRAAYFLQASNGVFVRMALILKLFSNFKDKNVDCFKMDNVSKMSKLCENENCISRFDLTLPKLFSSNNGCLSCFYCDKRVDLLK